MRFGFQLGSEESSYRLQGRAIFNISYVPIKVSWFRKVLDLIKKKVRACKIRWERSRLLRRVLQ